MITNIIPDYLREFASKVEKGTQTVSFMVNCKCQSTKFYLLENEETVEERTEREEFEKLLKNYDGKAYSDKNGNIFLSTKGVLGFGKKKIQLQKDSIPFQIRVIKAKCSDCGREILLFDNRKYGYDAIVEPHQNARQELKFLEESRNEKAVEIFMKIWNDLSYEEFIEEKGEGTVEEYSNAYSNIEIYTIEGGKKKKVFEKETA